MQLLRQILRKISFALIAAVLLFEEWGWQPLAALFARLARWPLWAWLERKIVQLPPYGALLVFGVPVLTLLPVKLAALYLFGKGQTTFGLGLLVLAKLVGTAVVARLFQLTQPSLMQLRWFAWWYPRWIEWKTGLLVEVRASATWRAAHALKLSVQAWLAGLRR